MVDVVDSKRRSEIMASIQSKGMKPEVIVRRLTHAMGYRYRLHRKDLPGKPDLVFPGKSKIIFVHGCFWHHHKASSCKIARVPKSNQEYWIPKLRKNVQRDEEQIRELKKSGWDVLVIWECEVKEGLKIESSIRDFLEN